MSAFEHNSFLQTSHACVLLLCCKKKDSKLPPNSAFVLVQQQVLDLIWLKGSGRDPCDSLYGVFSPPALHWEDHNPKTKKQNPHNPWSWTFFCRNLHHSYLSSQLSFFFTKEVVRVSTFRTGVMMIQASESKQSDTLLSSFTQETHKVFKKLYT